MILGWQKWHWNDKRLWILKWEIFGFYPQNDIELLSVLKLRSDEIKAMFQEDLSIMDAGQPE